MRRHVEAIGSSVSVSRIQSISAYPPLMNESSLSRTDLGALTAMVKAVENGELKPKQLRPGLAGGKVAFVFL